MREGDILKILSDPIRKEQLIKAHKLEEYMTLDIYEISELVAFARNEYLVTAGVPSDYLYFVMSGKTICFSYTSNEKNNCVSFTQHQTLMGEASSLFGKPPTFNVKALSDTVCIAINLPRYRTALLNDLTFVRNICELLASKINNEGRYSTTLLDPPGGAPGPVYPAQYRRPSLYPPAYRLRRCSEHQLSSPAADHEAAVRLEHSFKRTQLLLHSGPGRPGAGVLR